VVRREIDDVTLLTMIRVEVAVADAITSAIHH